MGMVAGYKWSVDSGHDDDGQCSIAKEKMGGGKILATQSKDGAHRLGRPAWHGRLLNEDEWSPMSVDALDLKN